MAGYLDQYGAGDEERARKLKRILLSAAGLLAASGILYFFLHNRSQEQQARKFFELLQSRDYQGAYAMWGCTTAKPCSGYPIETFMKDWGPPVGGAPFTILDGESCGNTVIVDVDTGGGDRKVWVNRDTLELSLPPNERGCVQAVVDEAGNLYYMPQHSRIYNWVRNMKYRFHGRTYQ